MENNNNWWDSFGMELKETGNKSLISIFDKIDSAKSKKDLEVISELISKNKELKMKNNEKLRDNFDKKIRVIEKGIERALSDNFGAVIKYQRNQKDLTLAKLADMTGMSPSYINRLEKGERKAPGYSIVKSLSEALSIPLSEMLEIAGIENENTSGHNSISKLILSNNVSYTDGGDIVKKDEKEALIEILEFVINTKWDTNKHLETMKLLTLIDKYKELQIDKN